MKQISNNLPQLIIYLLIVIIGIISYLFYEYQETSIQNFVESENLRMVKLEEENNLRSELDDIIEQYDNSRDEVDNLNFDLGYKQSEINDLKKEIRDLLNIKQDLKQAKKKIIVLQNISKKYFKQVDSLLGKTEELQIQNINLVTENIQIRNKNKNLNTEIIDAKKRLDKGSTLDVYDLEIEKIKIGPYGQERKGVIWAKNIQILRCCFKVSANGVAKAEKKSVYIQYFSPSGNLLNSDSNDRETVFLFEGIEKKTTSKIDFNYENEEIELCIDWQRNNILESGKYKILLFIEGKEVGSSAFKLN